MTPQRCSKQSSPNYPGTVQSKLLNVNPYFQHDEKDRVQTRLWLCKVNQTGEGGISITGSLAVTKLTA